MKVAPWLLAVFIVSALVGSSPAPGERSCYAQLYPGEIERPQRRDDTGWWVMLLAVGAVTGTLGWLMGKPDKAALIRDIDAELLKRVREAGIHSRGLKYKKLIAAIKPGIVSAVNKHL